MSFHSSMPMLRNRMLMPCSLWAALALRRRLSSVLSTTARSRSDSNMPEASVPSSSRPTSSSSPRFTRRSKMVEPPGLLRRSTPADSVNSISLFFWLVSMRFLRHRSSLSATTKSF